jgi:hypothetical protein
MIVFPAILTRVCEPGPSEYVDGRFEAPPRTGDDS